MPEINELIDKQDNFEIIRDQIAGILITERDNQMVLAAAAAKDPALWDFLVFKERSNPFETLKEHTDAKPVVNVWFDTSDEDQGRSNTFQRQHFEGTFNIDIIARGTSKKRAVGGLLNGDEEAFLNAHRVTRLVRNILMAASYRYLLLRGIVTSRRVTGITSYRPDGKSQISSINTAGIRISFGVGFNEFDPQIAATTIDAVFLEVFRAEDGQLISEMEFNNGS